MKILSVFGDFWDESIKNDQKNIITDPLGYEKSHASNTSGCMYVYDVTISALYHKIPRIEHHAKEDTLCTVR